MKSKFFNPMATENLSGFQEHFKDVFNRQDNLGRQEISDLVYGGKPIEELYSHIEIKSSKKQLSKITGDITLRSQDIGILPNLVLKNVSLKQFLVAGLPYQRFGTSTGMPFTDEWDGEDHWDQMHEQYRLELCHSEISRWSLFFKQDGKLAGDLKKSQISGDKNLDRIELVNNCTTSTGFEFRVEYDGDIYHGSFGAQGGIDDIYRELSQYQAGSLAYQEENLAGAGSHPSFGFRNDDIYHNFAGWDGLTVSASGRGSGRPENTIQISLDRYLQGARMLQGEELEPSVRCEHGKIKYDRWGDDTEYVQKALDRRLMISIQSSDGSRTKDAPKTYSTIYNSSVIELPDFPPRGIYNMNAPQPKKAYPRFSELRKAFVTKLSNGLYWLELRRQGCDNSFEFRRIVFGNLNLAEIPTYNKKDRKRTVWTLHRFGYGARNTTQKYQKKFALPHGKEKLFGKKKTAPHFAYLLAGRSNDPTTANSYICPESFGVERAIFTWESPTVLAIDLISFERILPVWQGRIEFPKGYVNRNVDMV